MNQNEKTDGAEKSNTSGARRKEYVNTTEEGSKRTDSGKKSRVPVKAFIRNKRLEAEKAKSESTQLSNTKALFYDIAKEEKYTLDQSDINEARRTGILKLNRRKLTEVPDEAWFSEVPSEDEKRALRYNFQSDHSKRPWWTFESLVHLDISHNCIKTLEPKGTNFFSFKRLYAHHNCLETVSEKLGDLENLEVLLLNDNKLTSIPPPIFDLTHLVLLKINNNSLTEIPRNVGNLIYLRTFDVSNNKLTTIPPEVGYLTELEEFYLTHNKLINLPEEMQSLQALRILDISNNCLEELPSFHEMPHLTEFSGFRNNIAFFPNFFNCRKLCTIQLGNNKVTELIINHLQGVPIRKLRIQQNNLDNLPKDIYRLTTIHMLDISYNQITRLPYELAELRNLTSLVVMGNPISNVRTDILKGGTTRVIAHLKREALKGDKTDGESASCSSEKPPLFCKTTSDLGSPGRIKRNMRYNQSLILTDMKLSELTTETIREAKQEEVNRVDLTRNMFSEVPDELVQLQDYLEELILRGNSLSSLPSAFGKLKNLQLLDISCNNLASLPDAMATCRLREIIAECNRFTMLPEVLYSIKTLQVINFCNNLIVEINVDGLTKLKRLFSLDLSNNSIEKVPPELGYLTHIKELLLHGNSFKNPRYDVLSKGTHAIMCYLRDKVTNPDHRYPTDRKSGGSYARHHGGGFYDH